MKNPTQRESRRALRERPAVPGDASLIMAPLPEWLTLQYLSPEFCSELTALRSPDSPGSPSSPRDADPRAGRRGKS
jgi:hypothetical protein